MNEFSPKNPFDERELPYKHDGWRVTVDDVTAIGKEINSLFREKGMEERFRVMPFANGMPAFFAITKTSDTQLLSFSSRLRKDIKNEVNFGLVIPAEIFKFLIENNILTPNENKYSYDLNLKNKLAPLFNPEVTGYFAKINKKIGKVFFMSVNLRSFPGITKFVLPTEWAKLQPKE